MEFKKFEDKLIIENIVNYCIENNISADEINALTVKIKFGKLNEFFLSEDWKDAAKVGAGVLGGAALTAAAPFLAPAAGAALAGGAALAPYLAAGAAGAAGGTHLTHKGGIKGAYGDLKKGFTRFTNKFTAKGKYANAIDDIQQNLNTAVNLLNAVHTNLTGTDNIFTKQGIVMPDDKKQDLINAVTQLKTAMDQYIPDVKSSLQNVGGEVSAMSNFGDSASSIDFDMTLPELQKGGSLEKAFTEVLPNKITEFNKIKSLMYKNIADLTKDKDSTQIVAIIQKFKTTIANSIKNLVDAKASSASPENAQALLNKAYIDLISLTKGSPAEATPSTTPAPAPTIPDNIFKALVNNRPSLHPDIKNIIIKEKNELMAILSKAIKVKGNKINIKTISKIMDNAVSQTPEVEKTANLTAVKPSDKKKLAKKFLNSIEYIIGRV